MKVLAIDGTYRPEGTTARLTDSALEGAAAEGVEGEHILLKEKNIQHCTNCLTCYRNLDAAIGPCPIQDDVRGILESVQDADGLILSSPVHAAWCTALMFAFLERATFGLGRPTGVSMGMRGCPEPRATDKVRPVATIVSAGGAPDELRQACDLVTPVLGWYGACMANGLPIGDLYAAARFPRQMQEEDWSRAMLLRELTEEQLQEAYDLGVKMARAIKTGEARPYDESFFEPGT